MKRERENVVDPTRFQSQSCELYTPHFTSALTLGFPRAKDRLCEKFHRSFDNNFYYLDLVEGFLSSLHFFLSHTRKVTIFFFAINFYFAKKKFLKIWKKNFLCIFL